MKKRVFLRSAEKGRKRKGGGSKRAGLPGGSCNVVFFWGGNLSGSVRRLLHMKFVIGFVLTFNLGFNDLATLANEKKVGWVGLIAAFSFFIQDFGWSGKKIQKRVKIFLFSGFIFSFVPGTYKIFYFYFCFLVLGLRKMNP